MNKRSRASRITCFIVLLILNPISHLARSYVSIVLATLSNDMLDLVKGDLCTQESIETVAEQVWLLFSKNSGNKLSTELSTIAL